MHCYCYCFKSIQPSAPKIYSGLYKTLYNELSSYEVTARGALISRRLSKLFQGSIALGTDVLFLCLVGIVILHEYNEYIIVYSMYKHTYLNS